ncbi:MAG: PKD domain-containing protein, partial [Gemmatimonadota bacterium]|nr:PKD domain-containing protein [Gemmatimonadota bacterium]
TFDGSGSTDPDGTIVSYEWDFGDGATGTGVSPSHTYAAAGTYDVTLTVTDNDGATDTQATTATIAEHRVLTVEIDIKPGSDPNSINLGSNGNVPVAILSTTDFDATTVNPATVTLADAQVKVKGNGTRLANPEDVNGDGITDLVVHIRTVGLSLTDGDVEAVLRGETFDGQAIEGSDSVRVVP